jgi:hypothetical protein
MEQSIDIKTNKYQTALNDELRKSIPREVYEDILEYISQVKFIDWLISPEETRGRAVDRPKETEFYDDGRIDVDVTQPHMLEDLDYFRERALYYNEHGVYTHIRPNPNPRSDYAAFWREESRRFRYGLVRPSDGEWIPGYLYFYWNYSPIWLVEKVKGAKKGSKQGERVKKLPHPWLGDYIFFHYLDQCEVRGQHAKNLKARGMGMSLKNAAMSPRNMYTYKGAGNPNFHLANEKSFLAGDKGIFGKIQECLDHIATTTPLPRLRIVDRPAAMEIQLGYKDDYGNRKGILTSVLCISLKDNPEKARGIRGKLCHYEEDGLFDNLEKAWNVNRAAFEDGGVTFGLMLAAGTGGTEGASFEGSEKLFYSPEAYNIYGIPNVFDKNSNGQSVCGHFWPAYLNRNGCYDLNTGEPDVIKALVEICSERHKIKYSASDANALTQKKAELPITPQEAVMRTTGTVFPVADIKEYMETIAVKKDEFLAQHFVGELVHTSDGDLKWIPVENKFPIRKYDVASGDKSGCLEIFEMPKKNGNGIVSSNRYIAGIDPIDSDTGESLFSILVMDVFTDKIVAEYSGRPRTAAEAYEVALRTLKFYNAQANYESNLKGLFNYFDKHNALRYLADVPQILKDMEMIRGTNLYGNKAKGTHASKPINSWGRQLQADWMRTQMEGADEGKLNLHGIRSLGYLEECVRWNVDGNFDRVSAGGMLFILREDRYKRTQVSKENQDGPVRGLGDDPFFSNNYKRKY